MTLSSNGEVEKNGGLVVISTYMPDSLLEEEHAKRRASRNGVQGLFNYVLDQNDVGPANYGDKDEFYQKF